MCVQRFVHRFCAQLFIHPSLQATARSILEQVPEPREPGERAGWNSWAAKILSWSFESLCIPWYLAWQNSWLHFIDKRFWSLRDHALSSDSLAMEKIAWMSNVKNSCLPHMIAITRMLSVPRYMFGICLFEALHTRDQVSHVGVEHSGPRSSARTFFGRNRARQPQDGQRIRVHSV